MNKINKTKKISKAPKISLGTKKKIKKFLDQDFKPAEIAEALGCTVHQVNAVKYNKVKMKSEPRADKGTSRKDFTIDELDNDVNENHSTEEILLKVINSSLFELTKTKMNVEKKIALMEKCSRMNKNLEDLKLYKYMKVADAELIVRLLRRVDENLSVEEIKKIYLEEFTILKNMKNKAKV